MAVFLSKNFSGQRWLNPLEKIGPYAYACYTAVHQKKWPLNPTKYAVFVAGKLLQLIDTNKIVCQ